MDKLNISEFYDLINAKTKACLAIYYVPGGTIQTKSMICTTTESISLHMVKKTYQDITKSITHFKETNNINIPVISINQLVNFNLIVKHNIRYDDHEYWVKLRFLPYGMDKFKTFIDYKYKSEQQQSIKEFMKCILLYVNNKLIIELVKIVYEYL